MNVSRSKLRLQNSVGIFTLSSKEFKGSELHQAYCIRNIPETKVWELKSISASLVSGEMFSGHPLFLYNSMAFHRIIES